MGNTFDAYQKQVALGDIQRIAANSAQAARATNELTDAVDELTGTMTNVAQGLNLVSGAIFKAALVNRQTQLEVAAQQAQVERDLVEANSETAEREIQEALGTRSSAGGYLNQLIETVGDRGGQVTTSNGATLSIGPKRS